MTIKNGNLNIFSKSKNAYDAFNDVFDFNNICCLILISVSSPGNHFWVLWDALGFEMKSNLVKFN